MTIGPLAVVAADLPANAAGAGAILSLAGRAGAAGEGDALSPVAVGVALLGRALGASRDLAREAGQRWVAGTEDALVGAPVVPRAVLAVADLDLAGPTSGDDVLVTLAPGPVVLAGRLTDATLPLALEGVARSAHRDAGAYLAGVGAEPEPRRLAGLDLAGAGLAGKTIGHLIDDALPP